MATTLAEPSTTSVLATTRGKLTLALLCLVAFLDFVDASIVNVALPAIRDDLGMTAQSLQWVPSAYLLTYGGFMLLGGRAADVLGRKRVLVAGTGLFTFASLLGGFAANAETLIGARLAQGAGAALMLPAALSILTTTFRDGVERHKALGAWGAMAGLGSAVGVLAGGILTDGPGWRWVMFVNVPAGLAVVAATFRLVGDERAATRDRGPASRIDLVGALLSTGGMLLLVHALVQAPEEGWSAPRTIAELAGAVVLLTIFVGYERRHSDPLLPMSVFRVKGLAAANATQLIGVAGFLSMFFFLTLYMQNVLGYSPISTGLAYLPVTAGVGVAAGVATQLIGRVGTRPVIVGGSLVASAGVFWLARVPLDGTYVVDILPGMVVMALGLGAVFVAVTTAANAGVPSHQAGLAAALLNASQQVGGALGLAIFSAVATSRTEHLLASHATPDHALAGGLHRALLAAGFFLVAAAVIGLRTGDSRDGGIGPDDAHTP